MSLMKVFSSTCFYGEQRNAAQMEKNLLIFFQLTPKRNNNWKSVWGRFGTTHRMSTVGRSSSTQQKSRKPKRLNPHPNQTAGFYKHTHTLDIYLCCD